MNKNAFAKMFYEQCTGTTNGHMALIPNNPVLYAMMLAAGGNNNGHNALSCEEFIEILREVANALEQK